MRLLDLYSGAGGAAMGYHRAGFEVTGVDVAPQPRYPFAHAVADVLTLTPAFLRGFDLIHASPPCQAYTQMSARYRGLGGKVDQHPDLLAATRELLQASGVPYVIENVIGAIRQMRAPIRLCGAQFGLGVHRPRLFETSFFVLVPQTRPPPKGHVGVYGRTPDGRRLWKSYRAAKGLAEGAAAMGIDWMTWPELKESIPPAYTEWLGNAFLAQQWSKVA